MTKILITGGNGFFARSLYESLSNSYFHPLEPTVVSLTRQDLDLLDADKVYNYLKENKFDVVIHTANHDAVPSFTDKKRDDVLDRNLRMFFNITSCSDYFGKMLYFGSGAEAGRDRWWLGMDEEYIESCTPSDPYGYSKHIMNKYAKLSDNIYNLRVFGVFGKFDDWRYRVIPNACAKAALDMSITIKKNARFDYLYVEDLTRIVDWFINNTPKEHSYNICTGGTNTYLSLAEEVVKASKKKLPIVLEDDSVSVEYGGDNSRFIRECGGFDFTPVGEAISELYAWYERNSSIIVKEEFLY
jgi:UDP-glucose 4-epimerase